MVQASYHPAPAWRAQFWDLVSGAAPELMSPKGLLRALGSLHRLKVRRARRTDWELVQHSHAQDVWHNVQLAVRTCKHHGKAHAAQHPSPPFRQAARACVWAGGARGAAAWAAHDV